MPYSSYSTYTYDKDGNATEGFQPGHSYYGGYTCTFDDLNHATGINSSTGTPCNFIYDARGLRVKGQIGTGTPTFYIFDGTTLLGEVQNNQPTAAYTWGADGLVSEALLTYSGPSTPYERSLWYGFGPQGETRQLTDSTGAVAYTYNYDAYGQPVATGGTTAAPQNPFCYGGKYGYYTITGQSSGTPLDLILCGMRWYDPGEARWINRDPIGYSGGDNLYSYCNDAPISISDQNGLAGQKRSYPPLPLGSTSSMPGNDLNIFWDWEYERGDTNRYYGPNDPGTQDLERSDGVAAMIREYAAHGCPKSLHGHRGTRAAFSETLVHGMFGVPNTTQAYVGGYVWKAIDIGHNQVKYQIYNQLSQYSFYLHSHSFGHPKRGGPRHREGDLNQWFWWKAQKPCDCTHK